MNSGTIIILIILSLILWAIIEQELLVITKYTVCSPKLPKQLNHTSFVVLADLHNMTFGKDNIRLVKKIEKLAPEFILVAGDLIDKKALCYPGNAYRLLESLAKKYRIYYAYGNHEQRLEQYSTEEIPKEKQKIYDSWLEFKERLRKMKVVFLDNSSTEFVKSGKKLHITGVSIGPEYFSHSSYPVMEEGYLEKLIGDSDEENYQLLIAHNPVYFYDYSRWGADLTVSGHLHGGMVRLPGVGGVISPQVKFFPKYNSGNHTENGQEMIVSRGLGTHSHMPRLFNIPEIVQVELRCKE
jgi:predicted MPP superfamily phosphohydrolase